MKTTFSRLIALCVVLVLGAGRATAVTETAELDADGYAAYQYIGNSVAASAGTVVAGAMYGFESSIDQSGNAYVFTQSGGVWGQQAKLAASDPQVKAHFGDSVAIDGDTIVVGAGGSRISASSAGALAGAAYVFVRSGATWTQQAKLIASDSALNDLFGMSVALDGDTLVVGAENAYSGATKCGAVYVFTRSGSTWTQQAKLTPATPQSGMGFGHKPDIDGNTLVCGAPRWNSSLADVGAAYVFVRSGATWSQQAEIVVSNGEEGDNFGSDSAVDGNTALFGATGGSAAYVYTRSGSTWTFVAQLGANDPLEGASFGDEVALSGGTALVGAPTSGYYGGEAEDRRNAGAAYVFTGSGSTWTQVSKLTPWRRAPQDQFSEGIALDGIDAYVGAFRRETLTSDPASPIIDGGIDSGAVFHFELNTTGPSATLYTADAEPLAADTFAVTLDFSAPVTGLDATDISVTNGTVSNFTGSGASYVFDVTLDHAGTAYVNVPDGVAVDGAAQPNIQSNVLVRSYGLNVGRPHSTDQNNDHILQLSELLRVIQIFNSGAYHCAQVAVLTEDGLMLGTGTDYRCSPSDADFAPQDWVIGLTELLRIIQFYNSGSYHECPGAGSEDRFCVGS